jgi:transcriptional regulator with XRE-family HTH domain
MSHILGAVSQFDADLGRWMAEQREDREMSQDAVAVQLGLDQPALSKIERGLRRVTTSELLHWAESVGVDDSALHSQLTALRLKHHKANRLGLVE